MVICKYIGGSKNFIENYHDIDEIYVIDDFANKPSNIKIEKSSDGKIIDKRYVTVESMQRMHYGLYNYYFAQLLKEGRVSVLEGEFPLIPNDKKLCELAMTEHAFNPRVRHHNQGASKTTYIILLALFYLRKGNCELTDEEKTQIRIAHDGYFPKEKLQDIQKELQEIYARL